MRKLLLYCFICIMFVSPAFAASSVAINAKNFPDENFRNMLLNEGWDADENGYLDSEEIASITELYIGGYEISSLKGIEYFTALEILDCPENLLAELDLSRNTKLRELYCYSNKLDELDLSKNTALVILYCGGNMLQALDLSKNKSLIELYCEDNQLEWLNIDNCANLESLTITGNSISELNIAGCPKLYYSWEEEIYDDDGNVTGTKTFYDYYIDCETEDGEDEYGYPIYVTKFVFTHVSNPFANKAPTITTTALDNAEKAMPYSFQLKAKGTKPITWSGSGLPDGLTVDSSGLISGTPKYGGTYSFRVTAKNSIGSVTASFTLFVAEPIRIDEAHFPDEKFRLFIQEMERWELNGSESESDGILSPEEISMVTELDFSGGVDIYVEPEYDANGDPLGEGYSVSGKIQSLKGIEYFTALEYLGFPENEIEEIDLSSNKSLLYLYCGTNKLKALDLSGNTVLQELYCGDNGLVWLNIDSCQELNTLSMTGNSIAKLNIGGCPILYDSWEEEIYDDDGNMTGTKTFYDYYIDCEIEKEDEYGYPIFVTDFVFEHVDNPLEIKYPPTISPDTPANGATGREYKFQLSVLQGTSPITWTLAKNNNLPDGLTLSSGGLISGTPTKAGKSSFYVTAENAYGSDSAKFSIEVFVPVEISDVKVKDGTIAKSYSLSMKAKKGSKPVEWSADGLPDGLVINPSSGKISGKPTVYGNFSVTVRAANGAGITEKVISLKIKAIPPKLSGSLAKAILGEAYSSGFKLSKGSTPVTWSVTGTLPDGLTLDSSTGIISGTPVSYAKSYKIIITASNFGGSASKSVKLAMKGTKPSIKTKFSTMYTGTDYSIQLQAKGSNPMTWKATGLPDGLELDGDTITGSPETDGKFTAYITASNPVQAVTKKFTITVKAGKVSASDKPAEKTESPGTNPGSALSENNTSGHPSSSNGAGHSYISANEIESGSYITVGEIGTVSCDEAGLYEFGVALNDKAGEGARLFYCANADNPSDDDEIAEFYDETGKEISAVPESRLITISIWLNPGTTYNPVIAVPSR